MAERGQRQARQAPISKEKGHRSSAVAELYENNTEKRVAGQRRVFLDELSEAGIQVQHALGQNFLYDRALLRRLAEKTELSAGDAVLEIGSGAGTFTEALLERQGSGRLLTIEIDRQLEPLIRRRMAPWSQARLLMQDARTVDFSSLCEAFAAACPLRVAANLPYYLTSELIVKVILELPQAASLAFLVQEEAAARLLAGPAQGKAYGPLSILTALYGHCISRSPVARQYFLPQPHIDSVFLVWRSHDAWRPREDGAVLESAAAHDAGQGRTASAVLSAPDLELRRKLLADIRAFYRFLLRAFAQRRKTMLNNFRASAADDISKLEAGLKAYDISPAMRAEALDWRRLGALFLFCHA